MLTYGDLPEPSIGPSDVKISVRACALNRLDVYARAGARGTRIRFSGPHILGGDVAGDVAEVGAEVTELKAGDRVVVNPRMNCGQCRACVAGKGEFCKRAKMLGSLSRKQVGGWIDLSVSPEFAGWIRVCLL